MAKAPERSAVAPARLSLASGSSLAVAAGWMIAAGRPGVGGLASLIGGALIVAGSRRSVLAVDLMLEALDLRTVALNALGAVE